MQANICSIQAPRSSLVAKLAAKLDQPGTLRVGWLENATAPNGDNLGLRAFRLEFGTSKMPPRPFFRTMIRDKSHEWGPALAIQLRLTNYDVDRSLKRLGEGISGQLRESIINTNSPPLAASTIARKGFSKPLIDTAHMIMSVDYEVII